MNTFAKQIESISGKRQRIKEKKKERRLKCS